MQNPELEHTIREKALSFLATRNHSAYELKTKLTKKFSESEFHIEKIICECIENKLLDDGLFAEQYVQYRQETSPRGRFSLQMELQQKGISPEIIKNTLALFSESQEQAIGRKLAIQKCKTLPHSLSTKKKKEKLFRFLASRGFDTSSVFHILDEVLDSGTENS